ncbi:MAG: hypothetical protein PHI32_10120 [Dysgonamonadaceae bacterium]|nr:hypothetical protein [Dysgonamonadaceae bacterium]MDD4729017.1 hypothetical protein [Dysgonamonadaceae bacterium]
MNKRLFILSITLLITSMVFSQSSDFNHEIGVSLKASTNGFGGDVYYRPLKKVAIKGGFEYLNFSIKSETLERYVGEDLNVTIPMPAGNDLKFRTGAKIKTGALSLAVGYQPFKMFYLTAGIGKNLFSSNVTGTPVNNLIFISQNVPDVGTVSPKISKEELGIFNISVKPSNTITPYVGIGLGSYVPSNKRYSFALELGAYYVGNYVLEATLPPGLDSKNINYNPTITQDKIDEHFKAINEEIDKTSRDINTEVNNAIKDINETIEKFKIYPVLKLTIGFRAFEFKK